MEITCTRCHEALRAESCYCPVCGLPQLVYSAENDSGSGQPAPWNEAVRDAASVEWKTAIRSSLMLAVPAGLLCSMFSPVNMFGLLWMAAAATWTVVLYVRSERPAWITTGAGARIGLVTGLLGGWTAASASGIALFAMRFFFHQGKAIDDFNQTFVQQPAQQVIPQWTTMGVDAQTIARYQALILSPEWRAGWVLCAILMLTSALLLFAVAGGALGARMLARSRRPEV
jgi:hypothetical protein